MFDPGPLNPLAYWLHVVLGFSTVVFALLALSSRKGGQLHRRAGQVFAVAMIVAALTAMQFFAVIGPAPPVAVSALSAIYCIGMAILSVRHRTGWQRALQWAMILIPVAIALLYVAFIAFAFIFPEVPLYLAILGPLAATIYAVMAWSDWKFMRSASVSKSQRARRHGLRMAVACVEVVRAPAISFGPQFLGEATFDLYSFGPYLLVPVFYFLALPDWLKQEAPATSEA